MARVGDSHRRQARAMFNWAEFGATVATGRVARYFGEDMDRCLESCDVCTGIDLLAGLTAKPVHIRHSVPAVPGSPLLGTHHSSTSSRPCAGISPMPKASRPTSCSAMPL